MINALLLVLAWGAFSAVARAEKLDFVYMPLYSEAAPAAEFNAHSINPGDVSPSTGCAR